MKIGKYYILDRDFILYLRGEDKDSIWGDFVGGSSIYGDGSFSSGGTLSKSQVNVLREANNEEISNYLLKEAIKRGYGIGTCVEKEGKKGKFFVIKSMDKFDYNEDWSNFHIGGESVYYSGNWRRKYGNETLLDLLEYHKQEIVKIKKQLKQ
jgi:hypothetical protein